MQTVEYSRRFPNFSAVLRVDPLYKKLHTPKSILAASVRLLRAFLALIAIAIQYCQTSNVPHLGPV